MAYLPTPDELQQIAPMATDGGIFGGGVAAPDLGPAPLPSLGDMTIGAPSQYSPGVMPPPPPLPAGFTPPQPVRVASIGAPPVSAAPSAPAPYDPDPTQARQFAQVESGNNPNAKNPNSSSSGLYGMTDETVKQTLLNHPELRGIQDPKNNPKVQAAAWGDNKAYLESHLGRTPDGVDMTAAWFLGAAGAVKFLHIYATNPNTPIDQAVGPAALAANHSVFYNADGSAKTVGEIYQRESGQFTAQRGGGSSGGGGSAAPAGSAAAAPANPFAQSQADLAAYKAGQPAMWAKLEEMQKAYLQDSKPTPTEWLTNFNNSRDQQSAANNALMHSNAGGILLHADPDNSAYIKTLQNSHESDAAQQAQRMGQLKTAYEMGSGNLKDKSAMEASNLGLTTNLTKDQLGDQNTKAQIAVSNRVADADQQNANTAQGKAANELAIKMAELGNTTAIEFQRVLNEKVPDKTAQAAIFTAYQNKFGNTGSLAERLTNLGNLVSDYIAGKPMPTAGATPAPATGAPAASNGTGGAPAPASVPAGATPPGAPGAVPQPTATPVAAPMTPRSISNEPMVEAKWFNRDTGRWEFAGVAKNNAAAQDQIRQLHPGVEFTDPTVPKPTTVSQTVSGGGGPGGGGHAPQGLSEQLATAHETVSAADAALKLIPILEKSGGQGPLTNPDGTISQLGNLVYQVSGGQIDPLKMPVRQILGKLVEQVRNGLVLPQMAQIGRATQGEMTMFREGTVPSNAQIATLKVFLQHTMDTANWTQGLINNRIDKQYESETDRTLPYNEARTDREYENAHHRPVWIGENTIKTLTSPLGNAPDSAHPDMQLKDGRTARWDATSGGYVTQ